ncbi:MAG: helix-turn-helix domain-containing protein [Cyclobacteriaceae bacterium]
MNVNELITKSDLVDFEKRIVEKMQFITSSTGSLKKQWLRSKEVQEMLGISASSLQNMRIKGSLPFSKINGTIFYDYGDIMGTLESNKMCSLN